MVIEYAPLEDELGDILEKALRLTRQNESTLAAHADVDLAKIRDAIDYCYDFTPAELTRLAHALDLNEASLHALAAGRYPLPEIGGLPFCLYPLRTPHGIGVANAYIVAECSSDTGILFDTGPDPAALRRVWPSNIRRLAAIFITHAETEHTGGLAALARDFAPCPVFGPAGLTAAHSVALAEGGRLQLGPFAIQTLSTPGHAESHHCYLLSTPRTPHAPALLISGDLIFAGSIGGAYFCARQLRRHLDRLLHEIAPSTVIAPGHGPLTTLGHERRHNLFAQAGLPN